MPVDARGAPAKVREPGGRAPTPFCSSRGCAMERARRDDERAGNNGHGEKREREKKSETERRRGSLSLICQISFHAPESGRDQLSLSMEPDTDLPAPLRRAAPRPNPPLSATEQSYA